MPQYLFEIVRNGQSLGHAWVELADICEVRREALRAVHDIAIDEMMGSDWNTLTLPLGIKRALHR